MDLKDQVCTLESAKRLKELGVEQESLFYYLCEDEDDYSEIEDYEIMYGKLLHSRDSKEGYSSFTSSELGEFLPDHLFDGEEVYELQIRLQNEHWTVQYGIGKYRYFLEKNESEARAKMLIYLLENNLLEPKE